MIDVFSFSFSLSNTIFNAISIEHNHKDI